MSISAAKAPHSLQKGFGPIIGISKQSCPVCLKLLSLLIGLKFIVRGSHNTITPCSLPAWLPSHVVDSMNEFFGGQLRRELLELMDRTEVIRTRKDSTGSHRLSADINMLNGHINLSATAALATDGDDDEESSEESA